MLPPLLIFEGDHHQLHWYPHNRPEGWKFGISENRWTSNALALRWLTDHFESLTRPAFPSTKRLLILDGHYSHKSWEFLNFCREHQIVVLCLPPHTTHKLQPLDVGCFQPLKHHYNEALRRDQHNGYTAIEKYRFIQLYKRVRRVAMDTKHITRAWADTGLIPLNRQKVCGFLK